ncbi:17277_t:CDS:2, partial [Dentiscutata heterogama]
FDAGHLLPASSCKGGLENVFIIVDILKFTIRVIPHHSASDYSATVDEPFEFDAGHLYLLIKLLDGLEESTYDMLDVTRTNVVETRARSGSESSSDRSDSSSSSSKHAKSDGEPLSDENDSLSKHTKSVNKTPGDGSDSSCKPDGSDSSWKPDESEDDETDDEDDKKKKQKPKLFWFVGPTEIETNASKIHNKWILDGTNISDLFFQFRKLSILKASIGKIERTSEILAINHIFLMQDSENDGHIIDRKLWGSAIQQVYQEYPLSDLPDNWLSKCNEMAEMARNDFKNNKSLLRNWYKSSDKESDDIIFDVFHNILNMYTLSGTMDNLHEDSFAHKVLSPIISPFFKDSFKFSSVWANETLNSSAYRKKKFDPSLEGREPDFAVYTSANREKENLLIVEIKPLKSASSNKDMLNDLVKIGNELKDCIDKMIDDGIDDNVPVCGILVEGKVQMHVICDGSSL